MSPRFNMWVPPSQEGFWDALLGKLPSPYKKSPQPFSTSSYSGLRSSPMRSIGQDKTGSPLRSLRHILLSGFHFP